MAESQRRTPSSDVKILERLLQLQHLNFKKTIFARLLAGRAPFFVYHLVLKKLTSFFLQPIQKIGVCAYSTSRLQRTVILKIGDFDFLK